ncbi:MAG: 7-cyano-7-deazaguanine synthase QueC, partial [bacterium]
MEKAIISLSGGQDSATCLAWARQKFDIIYTVSFYYGQRHHRELECSKRLSQISGAKEHFQINIEEFFKNININNNAMINDDYNVNNNHHLFNQLPATFVPFRNLFLLTSAAAKGLEFGVTNIVTGICQTDYSGYYDCRESFRKSLEKTLSESIGKHIKIHAPLMYLNKAETVEMMKKLGTIDWYKYT